MDKLRRTLAGDDEEQNEERGFASQVSFLSALVAFQLMQYVYAMCT